MKGNNVQVIMRDDEGLFIRVGTSKYRPPQEVLSGLRKGATVRAWPWSGGMKVEAQGPATVWPRV